MIGLLFVLILATALVVVWLRLLSKATDEDWVNAAYNKVLDNRREVQKLEKKERENEERLAEYHGTAAKVMALLLKNDAPKKIDKLETENEELQDGNLKSVSILVIPGYVLQRKYSSIGQSGAYKKILTQNFELYGKKFAVNRTKGIVAKLLSYPIIGVALVLAFGTILLAVGLKTQGIGVTVVGTLLVLVLSYAQYDEVGDLVNKRKDAICHQFPNVVSKLALLTTSGMIMNRAWEETANSGDGELYMEMRQTTEELNNLVSPEEAYSAFIDRCSTKETAKLASAIMQNLSKGNAEIGRLLKNMASEAWTERRNLAKRDSEKANSKLMIPTMMLFVAILIILMVPVFMSFGSL